MSSTVETASDRILKHISAIGAGRCAITEAEIEAEPDPELSQILVGLLVLHEDLTYARQLRDEAEAKRDAAARERERLLAELKAAVAARDQFLAIASHELRTPLATLSLIVDNFVAALTGPGAPPGPATLLERQLPTLRRQLDRLTTLVLEMLDVSRITGGGLDLVPTTVDLAAVVREVVDRFGHEIARRQVTVTVRADAPIVGTWDMGRLDQVVTNLLSNALKFGAGRPIEISAWAERSRAVVVVRDHGVGIPADERSKIFGPFSRALPARHHAGLGLGLWITHQIVRASGGNITVESVPGAGSTFIVELPR